MTSRALLLHHLSIILGLSPALLGALAPPAQARTWQILVDGSGDAPSVQAGIDSANVGDVVLVGPGTYYENLDFLGKDITVRSDMGPEVTILDGSSRDSSVVVFKRGETRAAMLQGFTLTGGRGSRSWVDPDHEGGGIYVMEGSPTIRGNVLRQNQTTSTTAPGGGMKVGTGFNETIAAPLIEENLFEDNESGMNGGGLGLQEYSAAVVRSNVFRGNHCRADGGGIWVWLGAGTVAIEDNEFWENEAGDHGGGIHAAAFGVSDPYSITGNLLVRNRTDGTGFFGDTGSGGGIAARKMRGVISRNTLVMNDGQHLTESGGGGLLLFETTSELEVSGNIIAYSKESGIACWWGGTATMGPNLLWMNEGGDLGTGQGACPTEWLNVLVIADPLFCGLAVDNYTVAENSPALTGEEVMGRYGEAGCGPVSIEPITWGRLKARYHE